MSRRKVTDPIDIREVKSLAEHYSIEFWQAGTWLVEGWLFIYPKDQKYGEKFRQVYGFYERGKLKEFVDKAMENKFKESDIFYGKGFLKDEEIVKS